MGGGGVRVERKKKNTDISIERVFCVVCFGGLSRVLE